MIGTLASKWRSFSACLNPGGVREVLLLTCLRCNCGTGRRMLNAYVSLQNSSVDSDMLAKLNLRPESHRADPRDKVPTTVKETTPQMTNELPIMHVKATPNNTYITLSDSRGKVVTWTSAGAVGFKGARRGTNFAGQEAGAEAARKALKLGMKSFQVKLKGFGPGRKPSLKGLEMGGINIITIQDVTPIPNNGCKPRKARRL